MAEPLIQLGWGSLPGRLAACDVCERVVWREQDEMLRVLPAAQRQAPRPAGAALQWVVQSAQEQALREVTSPAPGDQRGLAEAGSRSGLEDGSGGEPWRR